jgi:hypothetical protein
VVRGETIGPDGTLELDVELPPAQQEELARTPGVEVLAGITGAQTCAHGDAYLQSTDAPRAP